jgi:hypothetical protein
MPACAASEAWLLYAAFESSQPACGRLEWLPGPWLTREADAAPTIFKKLAALESPFCAAWYM